MKKDVKYTFIAAMYIIALFSCCMAWTFVTEYLQTSGFFGDVHVGEAYRYGGAVDRQWEWGARHYWYFWMCFILFILSVVRFALFTVDYYTVKKR